MKYYSCPRRRGTFKQPGIYIGQGTVHLDVFLRLYMGHAVTILYLANTSTAVIMIQPNLLITDIVIVHADRPLLYYTRRACALAGLGVVRADNDAVPMHEPAAYRAQEDAVVVELLEVVLLAALDGAL